MCSKLLETIELIEGRYTYQHMHIWIATDTSTAVVYVTGQDCTCDN